jgi:hypothetical protein
MDTLHLKIIRNNSGKIEYSVLKQTNGIRAKINNFDRGKYFKIEQNFDSNIDPYSDLEIPYLLKIYSLGSPELKVSDSTIIFFIRGFIEFRNHEVSILSSERNILKFLNFFDKNIYLRTKKKLFKQGINFVLTTNLFTTNKSINSLF